VAPRRTRSRARFTRDGSAAGTVGRRTSIARVPISKTVARFNRHVTNPIVRLAAGWVPPFALVEHVGRTSGKRYRTPVLAFGRAGRLVIALTYGPATDWVRNVLAHGGANVGRFGRTRRYGVARIEHGAGGMDLMPWAVRPVLRVLGVAEFLVLRPTDVTAARPIGQEREERTYRGVGPHAPDPRAAQAAAELASLIQERIHVRAEHVGSTAVPGLAGKNVVDLQITVDPSDVPGLTDELLGLGFERQRGRDPWPAERPMLEGTYRCDGAVLLVHCHVVPTTDPDVERMIAFRDLLLRDAAARSVYEAEKRRIAGRTEDGLEYTNAKTTVIRRLLGA
jgi:deazaflavin-dependent oxidoreductase (nitroreductase family)